VGTADILQIMKMIPHRYPMLMVDRVVDMEPEVRAVGIKNVTINESHFMGHFPTRPIMPGVMIVEAMAQTAAVLVAHSERDLQGSKKLVYFLSIENARFRRPVVPGDSMRIHITRTHRRANVWKFDGKCTVDDKVVAEANFSAMLVDG
jgi:3-hydroxyacyl-[acyl-carrier-protein] dehydratase